MTADRSSLNGPEGSARDGAYVFPQTPRGDLFSELVGAGVNFYAMPYVQIGRITKVTSQTDWNNLLAQTRAVAINCDPIPNPRVRDCYRYLWQKAPPEFQESHPLPILLGERTTRHVALQVPVFGGSGAEDDGIYQTFENFNRKRRRKIVNGRILPIGIDEWDGDFEQLPTNIDVTDTAKYISIGIARRRFNIAVPVLIAEIAEGRVPVFVYQTSMAFVVALQDLPRFEQYLAEYAAAK